MRAEAPRYEVVGLGVGSSVDVLIAQANEFRPKRRRRRRSSRRAEVAAAAAVREVVADLADLADDADVVVNAVVGFAGLPVTVAHAAAGKRLALANKESLIAAGPVVQPLRADAGRRAGARRQRALRSPPVPALVGGTPTARSPGSC